MDQQVPAGNGLQASPTYVETAEYGSFSDWRLHIVAESDSGSA
jgi:hypothetical protein